MTELRVQSSYLHVKKYSGESGGGASDAAGGHAAATPFFII